MDFRSITTKDLSLAFNTPALAWEGKDKTT